MTHGVQYPGSFLQALETFKQVLADRGLTIPPELVYGGDVEATMLRFLKARKFDIQEALGMYKSKFQG